MSDHELLIKHSLKEYFYQNLDQVNKKNLCPLPQEFLIYSSEVLEKYALSQHFFDTESGKLSEKVFGLSLLEANLKSLGEQRLIYKDVGDSILVQLGFFSERISKKKMSDTYYLQVGKSAYHYMEKLDCSFYDIPNFYNLFSTSLDKMIYLLTLTSKQINFETESYHLVLESDCKKVS